MDLLNRSGCALLLLLLGWAAPVHAALPYLQGFDDPAPEGWRFTGSWHASTASETVQVANSVRDSLVDFPDDGFWPAPWAGEGCLTSSDESTGTYVAPWDPAGQQAGGGGLSIAVRSDTAFSPVIDVLPGESARLRFHTWWEIESVNLGSADWLVVDYSTDSGATFQSLGTMLGYDFPPEPENGVPFSSGGYGAPPVWEEREFLFSTGEEGHLQLRFLFYTVDEQRNGFRGWFIDELVVECEGLYPPYGLVASETACDGVELSWDDSSSAEGVLYSVRRHDVGAGGETTVAESLEAKVFVDSSALPGAWYEYIVWGETECGSSGDSEPDTGIVPGTPPSPFGVQASDSLCGQVEVSWDTTSGDVQYYVVLRDGDSVGSVFRGSVPLFVDVPPDSSRTYVYRVASKNICGVAVSGDSDGGAFVGLPPPPTLCSATDSLCGRVIITWSPPTLPGWVDRYEVYRSGTLIGQRSTPPFSLLDTEGEANVVHPYHVYSVNDCGLSAEASTDSGIALSAPGPPESFRASKDRCGKVVLEWEAPVSGGEVWGYRITRGSPPGGTVVLPPDSLEYTDTPGVEQVAYALRAFNCEESAPARDTGRVVFTPPPPPESCDAEARDCDSVYISWNAVEDAAFGYVLTREGFGLVDSLGPAASSTGVGGLPGGEDLLFRLYAVNGCGRSEEACSTTTHIPGPIGAPPPGTCTASDDSCGGIHISWSWLPEEAEWFRVYRVAGGALVDSVPVGTTSVFDPTVLPGQSAEYTVQAGNRCGVSAAACTTEGSRPARPTAPQECAATENLCSKIRITWYWPGAAAENILGFYLYRQRQDTPSAPKDTFTVAPRLGAAEYEDAEVVPTIPYLYQVVAFDRCGTSAGGCQATGKAYSPPPAPKLLSPANGAANLTIPIRFTWEASARAEEYRFELYRPDGSDAPLVDTVVTTTSFRLDGADSLGIHYWRVSARNRCGVGPYSAARYFSIGVIPGPEVVSGSTDLPFGNGVDTSFAESTFVLENRWGQAVEWAVTETLSWIGFDPDGGVLEAGARETVHVAVAAHRCGVVYEESLRLTSTPAPPGWEPIGFRLFLEAPARPAGDVNWDCRVGTDDAGRLLSALLGESPLSSDDSLGADANGDGRINVADEVFLGWRLVEEDLFSVPSGGKAPRLRLEGGAEPVLSVSVEYPVRLVRLLMRAEKMAAAPTAADPERTILSFDPSTGRTALFWFHAGRGETDFPLLRFSAGADSRGPILYPLRLEALGAAGEWASVGLEGDALRPEEGPPQRLVLRGARPNPFNATTVVSFSLPGKGNACLQVFDVRGALVRTLVDQSLPGGGHDVVWDGMGDDGRPAASGLYFLKLHYGEETQVGRAMLLR